MNNVSFAGDDLLNGFAEGRIISRRCPPGSRLAPGMDVCAVVLRENSAALYLPAPREAFTAPPDAESFIVSLRDIRLEAGFRDLTGYYAAGAPGLLFRLGFYAGLTLRVAHIRGFSELLRRSADIAADTLFPMLQTELQPLVADAVTGVLGSAPAEYSQIIGRRAELQAAVEEALFHKLYVYGLCIRPHSFAIQGFARPRLPLS